MSKSIKHLEKLSRKRLGEILVDEGLISKSQLSDAEREQRRTQEQLGMILIDAGYITEWDLAKTVATQYQLPFIELATVGPSKEVQGIVAEEVTRAKRFCPVDLFGSILTAAVAEMPDIEFLQELHEQTGTIPFLFVALMSEIQRRLKDNGAGTRELEPREKPIPHAKPKEPPKAAVPSRPPAASAPAMSQLKSENPDPDEDETNKFILEVPSGTPSELYGGEDTSSTSEASSVLDQILPDDPAPIRGPLAPAAPAEDEEKTRAPDPGQGGGWESIFDSANEEVLREVDTD